VNRHRKIGPKRAKRLLLTLPVALFTLWATTAAADTTQFRVGALEPVAREAGLALERQRWSLGTSEGWIWRVTLPRTGQIKVLAAKAVTSFERFLPGDPGPWAVINGGFYDTDGTAMGLVVADGIEYGAFRRGGGSGVLELRKDGPRIIHHSAYTPGATQALQSIDRIVANGVTLVKRRSGARRAARSAIALSEDTIFLILAAQDESLSGTADQIRVHFAAGSGLPLWALADYVATHTDARNALNLDGSVSAQLAARIGGKNYAIRAMRGTINAIAVRP
jgi:hypothetical protein